MVRVDSHGGENDEDDESAAVAVALKHGGARPGAGRKPRELGRKPAAPVGFRPTELERAAIEQACADAELTISAWLRRLVRRELGLTE